MNMNWNEYLKKSTDEDIEDWSSALKSFIKEGKKLGIPLNVMELLRKTEGALTFGEGSGPEFNTTYGEDEEDGTNLGQKESE